MFAPREDWSRAGVEPSLEDLINDPIVHLVMQCGAVRSLEDGSTRAGAPWQARGIAQDAGAPIHRRRIWLKG